MAYEPLLKLLPILLRVELDDESSWTKFERLIFRSGSPFETHGSLRKRERIAVAMQDWLLIERVGRAAWAFRRECEWRPADRIRRSRIDRGT